MLLPRRPLSERADQEIYLFNNVLFFGAAQSALTSHAESMGFVDIQVNIGVVFFNATKQGKSLSSPSMLNMLSVTMNTASYCEADSETNRSSCS